MTTRALEDSEIKSIFEHVEGYNAKCNKTILKASKSEGYPKAEGKCWSTTDLVSN